MNETNFLSIWRKENPMYDAWGKFVVSEICGALEKKNIVLSQFLKLPTTPRLKTEDSLLDKAFNRKKEYKDPYNEIEDKVGCRFVVLLIDQIKTITEIIESNPNWEFKECRHFSSERAKEPLLFTYQSVHYVVKAKNEIISDNITIKKSTPCEIQIRTLLQHAYAELTHDAVYKAKTLVQHDVHRTVAKSMALIETTDDFFSDVHNKLGSSSADKHFLQNELDKLFIDYTEVLPLPAQKSSLVILDEFDSYISENTIHDVKRTLDKNPHLIDEIKSDLPSNPLYSQSIVLYVYYLIIKRTHTLIDNWPLNSKILDKLAVNAGVSLDIN
ncbi:(p)ppGpp synthetase [Pseudoalteromonas sp. SG43-1]|uniref:GTP pyrophosphokinase n=1 Tax=Pseudoalteromonas sp. SG43-1 TaxID=2760971 RepID=UPI0015FF52DC|nr:(p)ppGpp synthetase [Pseudoalteromonas sp. SG43-1]MBB1452332.1 (p)ppGpp synthetase [Pseudoalteromonas sp. SG43-1]